MSQSDKLTRASVIKTLTDTMNAIHKQASVEENQIAQEYLEYQAALPSGVASDALWARYQLRLVDMELRYEQATIEGLISYKKLCIELLK